MKKLATIGITAAVVLGAVSACTPAQGEAAPAITKTVTVTAPAPVVDEIVPMPKQVAPAEVKAPETAVVEQPRAEVQTVAAPIAPVAVAPAAVVPAAVVPAAVVPVAPQVVTPAAVPVTPVVKAAVVSAKATTSVPVANTPKLPAVAAPTPPSTPAPKKQDAPKLPNGHAGDPIATTDPVSIGISDVRDDALALLAKGWTTDLTSVELRDVFVKTYVGSYLSIPSSALGSDKIVTASPKLPVFHVWKYTHDTAWQFLGQR